MSRPKTVLMIGGPADGRWMVATADDIIVAEPATIDWSAPVASFDLHQIRYRVQPFSLFGFAVEVAVAEGEFPSSRDRNGAVVRALFQRDVAEAMGAYR